MPSELETQSFHLSTGHLDKLFTDFGRARERNLAANAIRHELVHELGRRPHDQIHDTGGQIGIFHELEKTNETERCLARRARHRRTTDRHGRRNLTRLEENRKIPRRNRSTNANGMTDGPEPLVRKASRYGASIGTFGLFRKPFEGICRDQSLSAGFRERLPLLHRHRDRDILNVLAHEIGDFLELRSAVVNGRATPPRQGCLSRLEGATGVSARPVGYRGEHVLGSGIDDIVTVAFLTVSPFTVDVELSPLHFEGLGRSRGHGTSFLSREFKYA